MGKIKIMTEELKITIPTSWEDITIAQFQEYISFVKNCSESMSPLRKLISILSILTDTDEDILYKLDLDIIHEINENMVFLDEEPTIQFKNIIEIKGKKYGFQKDFHKLTLGEWIDIEHYITTGDLIENLHYLAAIFYRKLTSEGDEYFSYEIEDYKNVKLEGQATMFKYEMNIVDMYGTVSFFLHIVNELCNSMNFFSTEMTMEEKMKMMIERVKDSKVKKKLKLLLQKNQGKNSTGNFSSTEFVQEIFLNMTEL